MSAFVANYSAGSPAFTAIAPYAQQLAWSQWPSRERYYSELNGLGAPVQFVEDNPSLSYELHIGATRQVPTRYALWHDYFNALIWTAFARSKTQLNSLHRAHWTVQADAEDGSAGTKFPENSKRLGAEIARRTPVRDGLTLLDESGALVICDDEHLLDLLRNMRWPELFVSQRARVEASLRVIIFGHGLLEKFLQPYIGMTSHALLLSASREVVNLSAPQLTQWADQQLAAKLCAAGQLTAAELYPLPMLGLPGWWPANADPAFYENERYFRRSRRRQSLS